MKLRPASTNPRSLTNTRIRAFGDDKMEVVPTRNIGLRERNPRENEFLTDKEFVTRVDLLPTIKEKAQSKKKTLDNNLQNEITNLKDEIK